MAQMIDIIKCVKEVAYARAKIFENAEFYPMLPPQEDFDILYQELAKLYVDIHRYDGLIERFYIARFEREIANIIEKELEGIRDE